MTTPRPFPSSRTYDRVRDLLGEQRLAGLVGSREVVELAIHPDAQGNGIGRELLLAIAGPGAGPAWLLTAQTATGAIAFYDRAGLQRVVEGDGLVVYSTTTGLDL
jgi:ribosomal protein S18 acetylase RimI-like enzyme